METDISISLRPYKLQRWPYIKIGVDNMIIFQGILTSLQEIHFNDKLSPGEHALWLEYTGKTNADVGQTEQAVEITGISMQGISTDRMIWAGVFEPVYPEPWYTQQIRSGHQLPKSMTGLSYLGFNGVYTLTFTSPVFRWIHELENLGWILP
jgi:hypothetical protein